MEIEQLNNIESVHEETENIYLFTEEKVDQTLRLWIEECWDCELRKITHYSNNTALIFEKE